MKLHSAKIEEKKITGTHPGFRAASCRYTSYPFVACVNPVACKALKIGDVHCVPLTPGKSGLFYKLVYFIK